MSPAPVLEHPPRLPQLQPLARYNLIQKDEYYDRISCALTLSLHALTLLYSLLHYTLSLLHYALTPCFNLTLFSSILHYTLSFHYALSPCFNFTLLSSSLFSLSLLHYTTLSLLFYTIPSLLACVRSLFLFCSTLSSLDLSLSLLPYVLFFTLAHRMATWRTATRHDSGFRRNLDLGLNLTISFTFAALYCDFHSR